SGLPIHAPRTGLGALGRRERHRAQDGHLDDRRAVHAPLRLAHATSVRAGHAARITRGGCRERLPPAGEHERPGGHHSGSVATSAAGDEGCPMDGFWDWFWLMVWWFLFIAYLVVLFQIVADLFRDKALSGWWKALWIVALIVLPYLAALVYVIARGRGMAERHAEEDRARRQVMDEYVRATAGSGRSPASEVADAKALLGSGTFDADEFARLKARALA